MRDVSQKNGGLPSLNLQEEGEARNLQNRGTNTLVATNKTKILSLPNNLLEEICERENLKQALTKVISNKGAPGVDDMKVEDLKSYLRSHWINIKDAVFNGSYSPQPVKRVTIPKPGGGHRQLGIPTVLDRFIQQAMLQVLQKYWDKTFLENTYGFRPNRSAHQAILKAQEYIAQGNKILVDIDLENFFDRVQYDKLMSEMAKRIEDKRVLKLIRSFLNAGIMENEIVKSSTEGTPQGGPLSPFLSNVILDLLDKELERRGHLFVRNADDCNIYVKTDRSGKRVMESIKRFVSIKLKLKVNENKSAVAVASCRKFLGFTFTCGKLYPKRRISPNAIKKFKDKIRYITVDHKGASLLKVVDKLAVYMKGWSNYYGLCQTPTVLEQLEQWIRRRLRNLIWQQWKTCRRKYTQLTKLGIDKVCAHALATSSKGNWSLSKNYTLQRALCNKYFEQLGVPMLKQIGKD
ncbi:MAG: hypothetical protein HEEMFOPI_01697 [Holosporales bacterium]